ncbi:hypothetical protein BK659_11800 [Pseudomonas brassicacearum]|uniref:Uncharacterized protein n=1 Tax=Pseudomonas brassicacearum TaxID=930166 RepID=A0A423H6X8_9PSED|nr:hypothetical protein [Pseudomonas brassicacearum]RON08927.1 hypothetical protein BK659_11800 [Pseudomonas brassicacearum]
MGKRKASDRAEYAPLESGTLDDALRRHSAERIRHFFLFCFYVEVTCDYLSTIHGETFEPTSVITDHATHQVDTGVRDSKRGKLELDSQTPADLQVTGWGSMDAAHFNNLGLKDNFLQKGKQLGEYDPMVSDLLSRCVDTCRNTRWLPQAINLGPDKVIDIVHRVVHIQTLSPTSAAPCASLTNIRLYIDMAISMLKNMADKKADKNTLKKTEEYYRLGLTDIEYKLLLTIEDEVIAIVRSINTHLLKLAMDSNSPANAQQINWSAIPKAKSWFAETTKPKAPRKIVRAKRMGQAVAASQNIEIFDKSFYIESPML